MELRMQVDEDFGQALLAKLKLKAASDMAKEALTLLNWAVQEREYGRVILSAMPDGKDVRRLAMPVLEQIQPTRAEAPVAAGAD